MITTFVLPLLLLLYSYWIMLAFAAKRVVRICLINYATIYFEKNSSSKSNNCVPLLQQQQQHSILAFGHCFSFSGWDKIGIGWSQATYLSSSQKVSNYTFENNFFELTPTPSGFYWESPMLMDSHTPANSVQVSIKQEVKRQGLNVLFAQ